MRGLSLTLAVGKWARPHIAVKEYTARICLGFVALTFYTLDVEEFIKYLIDKAQPGKDGE
jgi:hypothetical protein